jgi:hypothetical protein
VLPVVLGAQWSQRFSRLGIASLHLIMMLKAYVHCWLGIKAIQIYVQLKQISPLPADVKLAWALPLLILVA